EMLGWSQEKKMSTPRYPVTLTAEQREQLTHLIRTGRSLSYQQVVARVLLKADRSQGEPPPTDGQIAEALEISRRTVIRIKERFAREGLEAALRRNYPPTRPLQRRVHGQEEAHLIALACGPAPEGQQRWTLRLLADKMVQLQYVEQISYETIRQVLKKP
ncbi:MAG TPA: helix-turn-helix domain-containing protein, partial [Ktedonobacteraceae bacterium]|nr:helix-turn-helix domain-containing protein [Ktedonobacteraceae bacterium]